MQNYNNKELQTQTGYYDYGFRQLDPALGRWFVVDAMAEKYFSESPYSYAGNNPVNYVDVLGLAYTYNWDDGKYYDDNGNEASWSDVSNWIQGGISDGSLDGFSITFQDGGFDNKGEGLFSVTLSGGQNFSFAGISNVQNMVNLALSGYTFTIENVGGENVMFSSKEALGDIFYYDDGDLAGYYATNETAAVFLGKISLNEYNALKNGFYLSDTRNGSMPNIALFVLSGAFTTEDLYNNFVHSHTQSRTTGRKIKNIYKANGQFRSANAAQAAKISMTVKIVGEIGTGIIVGNAVYNIERGNGTAWDWSDATVGTIVLVEFAGSLAGYSVPVVGQAVALYSWGRFWYEMGGQYGPIHRIWGN